MKATLTWVHYDGWKRRYLGNGFAWGGGNEVDVGCLGGWLLVRGLSFRLPFLRLGFFCGSCHFRVSAFGSSFRCVLVLHWSGHLTGEVLVCHVVDLPAIANFDFGSVVVWLVDTSAVFCFVLGLVPVGVPFFRLPSCAYRFRRIREGEVCSYPFYLRLELPFGFTWVCCE